MFADDHLCELIGNYCDNQFIVCVKQKYQNICLFPLFRCKDVLWFGLLVGPKKQFKDGQLGLKYKYSKFFDIS